MAYGNTAPSSAPLSNFVYSDLIFPTESPDFHY